MQERLGQRRRRMATAPDTRAVRTRQRLVAAYRELAGDREPSAAELAAHAGVTRSTFYAHFEDTGDLAVAALAEVFDVVASVDSAARRSGAESPAEVSARSLAEVIGFVDRRRALYGDLLTRRGRFAQAVEEAFARRALGTLLARGHTAADPALTARFIAAGVMGVVAWWLREDPGWTPRELADHLARVIPVDFTEN